MSRTAARIGLIALVLSLVSLGVAPPGTPSAMDRDSTGWTDLLAEGGTALKGWTRATLHAKDKLDEKSQWEFAPSTGVLICEGNGGHEWLRWD